MTEAYFRFNKLRLLLRRFEAVLGPKEDYWGFLCGQKPVKNRYIFLVNFRRFPEGPWKGLRHGFDLTPPPPHLGDLWREGGHGCSEPSQPPPDP